MRDVLGGFIARLPVEVRDEYTSAVTKCLTSPDGQVFVEVLERAVIMAAVEPADDRALRENHGMRLLALEIRRLAHRDRTDRTAGRAAGRKRR